MDEIAKALMEGMLKAVQEANLTPDQWEHFKLCLQFDAKESLAEFEIRNVLVRDLPKAQDASEDLAH